jgi:hypothetical protein
MLGCAAHDDGSEVWAPTAPEVEEEAVGCGALCQRASELRAQGAPHEMAIEGFRSIAGQVPIGMTRAEVEQIFIYLQGGVQGPGKTQYVETPMIVIEVPFDQAGGAWRPTNRVTAPLRVFRARWIRG